VVSEAVTRLTKRIALPIITVLNIQWTYGEAYRAFAEPLLNGTKVLRRLDKKELEN
jgi:hypothetical protein